jgi:N-dimethylarginine dimethylaminohydrolase
LKDIVFMAGKTNIYVDYEYGDLKEVIVGVPFNIYPDMKMSDWVKEGLKILPESEQKKIMERSGKSSLEIGKYDAMEKENQELISIFQKYGIKVWRIELLTRDRLALNLGEEVIKNWGVSFQYSRDPILVVGNNVIELTPGSLFRTGDLLAYRKLFVERVLGSNASWFAMPKLDYSQMFENGRYSKNGFPVLEGGDIHVLGKKILVGTSLNPTVGSSERGFLWLGSILEPQGYDVERVIIKERVSSSGRGLIGRKAGFGGGLP